MHFSRTPALAAVAAALVVLPAATAASAADVPGQDKDGHYRFAVIGDVPYGDAQVAAFPTWVDQINATPDLSFTIHVGDIKNGSSRCTNEYFSMIRTQFDRFTTPLVYTPGDNEWTDCHRTNNGTYDPLERLAAVRSTFFPRAGHTLGADMTVTSQAAAGFPENVSFRRQGVDIATLHVVGSNNGLLPWPELGFTSPTARQLAEEQARTDNAVAQVRSAFAGARQRHDRAVALFLQADMFDPTYAVTWADNSAFQPLVRELVEQSSSFDGEVYLFNGDSHVYNSDRPLAAGSRWLDFYGVRGSADNLTRVTVDGSSNNTDFLEVTVNRPGAEHVLSWERVPYTP
ncbi:metallophosphoesterase [Terracoccus sp. 273MFTsu3.1]|uniref:metallophosphoesterase n=1 Tax=Terracoccus sp. 273MFTsu3.1 TaxID=1172188 RepID=UPI00035F1CB1|nr:metallophosphoesterase [Terracoccus sp. 273MFTsu3.1]